MAVETRLNSINFAGLDGFPYFRGQVTTDAAWRQHSKKYGYRVKVRIFGVHPPTDEVPDSELPWAPVIVSCNFGSGKAFAGTSLNLQGGETVIGFFADNDKQQPVIFGCYQSEAFHDNIIAYPENADGSTMFYEMEASSELVFGENNMPANHEDPKKLNGIPDNNNNLPNGKTTKQKIIDEENLIVRRAQKCKGDGFGNEIQRALASFVEVGGKFENYQDAYIDPVMDEMRDVQKLVGETAQVISDSYAQVIRLSRSFLFAKIAELSEDTMGFLQLDSLLKDIEVKKAKDSIYCLLEKIIKSLKNVIKDFLTGLLGKLVQAPLCAAEQFLAGLNSRMFNEIESAIGNAMSALSGILGPTIGNFMGFMDKAMNYAQIGLKLLECEDQECEPQPYDWALNFGPDKQQKLDFKKTIDISSKFNVAGIGKSVSDGIDKFFGLDDDDLENAEYVRDLLGPCPINNKVCGPPKIEIFGGGGFGAAANAVINELGEIVGVNMQSLGVGYTEKPFVTILDNCDGRGAEGEAILEDGKVVNIIIRDGGGGYQVPDQVSDADGIDVVGEIEGVEIIRTGRDYESGDLITSDCGTLEPVLDNTGRIVGANVLHADLGCKVIPKLRVKSDTGYGALLRPIMRYKKVEDYDSTIPLDSNLIMKVVDCVSSY